MNLKAVDVLHVYNPSILGRGIAWFTKGKNEEPTKSTHVGIAREDMTIQEARKGKIQTCGWKYRMDQLDEQKIPWMIMRREIITDIHRVYVKRECEYYEGKVYSFPELALHALDGLIEKCVGGNVIFYRRLGKLLPRNTVCSGHVGGVLSFASITPMAARFWSPDDLFDWQAKSREWRVAFASPLWLEVWMDTIRRLRSQPVTILGSQTPLFTGISEGQNARLG